MPSRKIDWLTTPEHGQVVTKNKLLKDIKTNMISLLNDYIGRGIENEARLISEVQKMFKGGIVPSRSDWMILNLVLRELSEVKEQGKMYEDFIKDVSDSLGVSDLIMIRNFIEYITTLPPIAPQLSMTIDTLPQYGVYGARATFDKDINQWHITNRATAHWLVSNPVGTAYARVKVVDSASEDIEKYEITLRAGTHNSTQVITSNEIKRAGEKTLLFPISHTGWFGDRVGNLTFTAIATAIDKRGNKSNSQITTIYPPSRGIPQGYSTFNVQYRATEARNWQSTFGYTSGSFLGPERRTHGPMGLLAIDGNHEFRVRGYDPGVGWSSWSYSPKYNLTFRGERPGKPNPIVTSTSSNRINFKWKPTSDTDYYEIYYREPGKAISRTWRINTSSNPNSYFSGLKQNTGYTIYVRAYNKYYDNGTLGTVWGRTKKAPIRTVDYVTTGHTRYNGQSYYQNSAGYYRPKRAGGWRNAWGVDRPHWKPSSSKRYNRWQGSLIQGHWRETNWRVGWRSENYYCARSGGAYQASDGQSHGNNATFIMMDYHKMRRDLKDQVITKVEIWLEREGSIHGDPNIGNPVYLYNHNRDYSGLSLNGIYTHNRERLKYANNWAIDYSKNFARNSKHAIANNKTIALVNNIVHHNMKGFAFLKYYAGSFNNSGSVPRGSKHYIRFKPSYFTVRVFYRHK